MTHRFSDLMFTPHVKKLQERDGSRGSYARFEKPDFPARDRLTEIETSFIAARDSFYIATLTETGWPYVQHRGGAPGFLKVLDARTLGFADYPGNRQFITRGNLDGSDRVALFLMDYPNRRRLKILGHATPVEGEAAAQADWLERGDGPSRGLRIAIEGFDWNCPKYITPRFTEAELRPLATRLEALEAENADLRAQVAALTAR